MVAANPSQAVTIHKGPDGKPVRERQDEQEEMAEILEQLNIAAVNNRAFSISDETRQLLQKFKLIFKDLINGVPTAYHDLESLLTNGDEQLQHAFNHLPGFLQKLVKQLFEKLPPILIPEGLATAGEESGTANMENAGKIAAAATVAKKIGFKAPNLKELVGKPTALVGMLRTIVSFLRTRFPAVMGINILWSLALFGTCDLFRSWSHTFFFFFFHIMCPPLSNSNIHHLNLVLLMALWYCHKRGSEVRLEKERLALEAESAEMDEASAAQVGANGTLSTITSKGGSNDEELPQASQGEEQTKAEGDYISPHYYAAPPSPTLPLSKHRVLFNKSESSSKSIQPYPGT